METVLEKAAHGFTAALKADPAVKSFFAAREAYEANEEVYNMRMKYTQLVHDLRIKQTEGSLTEEDVAELRALEEQVNAHEATRALSSAQAKTIELLQSCNTAISERVGFDYASSAAAPKSCGC